MTTKHATSTKRGADAKAGGKRGVAYELESTGAYRIDGYDQSPAFSSFLPGIGGLDGVPLWCLYVNRGQAVVSFGSHGKNGAVLEYLPANWAYELVGTQGFRTFCRIDGHPYEPFADRLTDGPSPTRSLRIEPDRIELIEEQPRYGLRFDVEYFSLVNQPVGALVRRVRIHNQGNVTRRIHGLDGLPVIVPAGFTDPALKTLRHIIAAYASVRIVDAGVPFYASKVVAHDEADVTPVEHGNFYTAWLTRDGEMTRIEPFVDPAVVFGQGRDLVTPRRFYTTDVIDRATQVRQGRLPCALVPFDAALAPGESVELLALAGCASSEHVLTPFLANFTTPSRFDAAREESRRVVNAVTSPAFTVSGVPELDYYARQNYLDNVLRGGVPLALPSATGDALVHVYARRHGDLERDYNSFELPPHPLSSGGGNFRDICQNRRSDVWFYPDVWDREIRSFVELMQPDGFNPLIVEPELWKLRADVNDPTWTATIPADHRVALIATLRSGFRPGELLQWAADRGIELAEPAAWLRRVLADCTHETVANGHEGGYWIDHWTYLVDLLDAFAGVYPDRVPELLTGPPAIGWYMPAARVTSRGEKFIQRSNGLAQLNAVVDAPVGAKLPGVTLLGKLCALLAVKAVSFDAACRGIEMEAGRPGWNDALNGLPALFGSSSAVSAEVGRLARWLRDHIGSLPDTAFPSPVAELIESVAADVKGGEYDWNRAVELRDRFRQHVEQSNDGQKRIVAGKVLEQMLFGVERRARRAVDRSIDAKTGLMHTYFWAKPIGEAAERTPPDLAALRFEQHPLPLFFEGQIHRLRLVDDPAEARTRHEAMRNSPLFDAKLQMYKVNECLDACSDRIGRARTFPRSWFENESIWLHLSYKYLLELLRAGLHSEFFNDVKTMLVPFMDPRVYGRSILENSSFLCSSDHDDPANHGRGFIARLSGSTAEFIHMWLLLTLGSQVFYVERDELHFQLLPALPGEWFTKEPQNRIWNGEPVTIPANAFACALLGSTLLIYHNEDRANTFGPDAVRPQRYLFDERVQIDAERLGPEIAERVRKREYRRIDVWLD